MHKVLIVDDEPIARASLTYLIDWESCGFSITAEASNGHQALELMRNEYFSLVVTDVRMPVMDGLAFISELRKFSDTPVIILSGYEDFEYARQGLKMGVQDYLLKPVDEDDLIRVLRRMSEQLEKQYWASRQQSRGLSALQESFLRKWGSGGIKSRKHFDEQRMLAGLPDFQGQVRYGCLIAELDHIPDEEASWSPEELELRRFSARNIIEEVCGASGLVFEMTEERFGILLLLSREENGEEKLGQAARSISDSVANFGKQTVSVGIGSAADDYASVPGCLDDAAKALDGKFLTGRRSILTKGMFSASSADLKALKQLDAELLDAVRTYRKNQIDELLGRIWMIFRSGQVQESLMKTFVLDILVQLFRLLKEAGANEYLVFDHEYGDFGRVMKAKTMDELLVFTTQKCQDAVDSLLRQRDVQPNQSIEEVKAWVSEHYGSHISLRAIAAKMYMNPVYLGQLFKSQTEMSFNDYLLKVRMEKAIELLLHSDKKVYEIAYEVGYKQLDWFYKKFKAYTGISAGEYRASINQ